MALVIDSTDAAYIAAVKVALTNLLGNEDAVAYRTVGYRTQMESSVGLVDRYVVRIEAGPQMAAALVLFPHSATLVQRVIQSQHWTRILQSHANDCTPDKWFKDSAWSAFKSWVPGVKPDAGFMQKVLTSGTSSVARWSGDEVETAVLSATGTIQNRAAPAYVLLAHELIHSDRIGRGRFNPGIANSYYVVDQRQRLPYVPGVANHLRNQPNFLSARVNNANLVLIHNGTQIPNAGGVITSMRAGYVWLDSTMERAEEIATVGLGDPDNAVPLDPLAITENMIRSEHRESKRLRYGRFARALA